MYYRYKLNITRHQPYSSNMNKLFKRKFMIIYLFWMTEFWHKSQVIIKWHFFREAGNLTIHESNEQPIHATSSEIYSQDLQTWNTTFFCAVLEWLSTERSSYIWRISCYSSPVEISLANHQKNAEKSLVFKVRVSSLSQVLHTYLLRVV